VNSFGDGLAQAWQLIITGNPVLVNIVIVTIQVAAVSTGVGLVLGLPAGLALGLGRFPGRRFLLALANIGLICPPVLVGLVLILVLIPVGPFGFLHLSYTLNGVFIAQALLALPVVIALTASAVRGLPSGLLDQARAFGASRWQLAVLSLREARVGIVVALIAAVGSSLSEVAAVVIVGGNIQGRDETLASAVLQQVNAGNYADAVATGIVLVVFIAIVIGALTALQWWDGRGRVAAVMRRG
jgi:tungstate transport system permease protein